MGRERPVYEQPGTRLDGIAPRKEEGFQVSKGKGGLARGIGKGSQQRELTRGCAKT
jgi:hypothetical protein